MRGCARSTLFPIFRRLWLWWDARLVRYCAVMSSRVQTSSRLQTTRSLWHPSHRLLDITPPSTLDFKIKKLEIRKSRFKL